MRRLLLLAVLVVAGLLAAAGPASAHASLVSVSPTSGSTLTTAPTKVVLTFDENIRTPSTIIVTGPSGRVDRGRTQVVDNHASIGVELEPAPSYVGSYRVDYRVVSADGHPVAAEETFRYAPPGVTAAPTSAHDTASPRKSSATWWIVGGVVVVALVALLLLTPFRRKGAR